MANGDWELSPELLLRFTLPFLLWSLRLRPSVTNLCSASLPLNYLSFSLIATGLPSGGPFVMGELHGSRHHHPR